MKTKIIIALALSLAGLVHADIVPPVRWDVETGRMEPRPYTLMIRRGENIKIEPRFLTYNAPMNLTNAAIEMRYSAAYNSPAFYSAPGTLQAETGRVQIAWSDALNPINNSMVYEIRATVGTNVLARAFGPFYVLGGMVGIYTGLTARTSINWATVSQSGGTAILANQMGSGSTWNGTQWTFGAGSVDLSFTNRYYLASNPSNYCTLAAAGALTNGLQPAGVYLVPADTNRFVDASITNGLGGGAGGVSASDVTNALDLARSPSLTGTVAKAGSALQADDLTWTNHHEGIYQLSWFTISTNYTAVTNWGDEYLIPEISIDGYVGPVNATVVHIPPYINGIPVKTIGPDAFHPNKYDGLPTAASVYIPETVTYIGDNAFQGCVSWPGSAPKLDLYFYGNAPAYGSSAFSDSPVVFHYLQGATGFTPTYYSRTPILWDRVITASGVGAVPTSGVTSIIYSNPASFLPATTTFPVASRYLAGTNAAFAVVQVLASAPGITATITATNITFNGSGLNCGLVKFNIPSNTVLLAAQTYWDATDAGAGSAYNALVFDVGTNDMANVSMSSRWVPRTSSVFDTAGSRQSSASTALILDTSNFSRFRITSLSTTAASLVNVGW